MWRASLILQKSREAMARKEMDVDETSQSSVLKATADELAVTEQVTTSGWQRELKHLSEIIIPSSIFGLKIP